MSKWHEKKWQNKAELVFNDTKAALQTVYDALNQGQQKQIVKHENVKALFDHYGVNYN